MPLDVVIRDTCLLCGSPDMQIAVPIKPSPIADAYWPASRADEPQPSYPLDLHLCGACGHVQLAAVVNPETLFKDYIYQSSASASLMQHFGAYADLLAARFAAGPSALAVDIGSNDGSFLRLMKASGFRVLGVDPATRIAAQATADGIPTVEGFFSSSMARAMREEHGQAAVVTANNVFAHSDTLPDMADGIRELLAPAGVFVFEVSYLGDILDRLLFDTVYHEHLSYHSLKPLVSFLRSHGLEVFDVMKLASKGGSIRVFAQLTGGPHHRTPVVDEILDAETRGGLDTLAVFQRFSNAIAERKAALQQLLARLKGEGASIAGFGASATVTTLLFNFEVGRFLDYLVDDNTARHGLISPGLHLPVRSTAALYEQKPDYCVILAWQYARPIVSKHQAYAEQGGRFIMPMPEVEVLA